MSGWSTSQEIDNAVPGESVSERASEIDVDEWMRIVAKGSRDQRLRAAYAPPRGANRDRVVPALMTLAGDIQQDVRVAAIYALGEIGDQRSYALLQNSLDDRAPRAREAAVWAVNKMRIVEAMPVVVRLLDDKDRKVRVAANWYLAQTAPLSEREPLLNSLDSSDSGVRVAAVWGLSVSPLEEHRSAARRLFLDSSAEVREAAAWSFAEARDIKSIDSFYRGLADPDQDVREAMAGGLTRLDDPGGTLATRLINGEAFPWSDIESVFGKSTATSFLIALLESDDSQVRRIAAAALGQSGENAARAGLIALSESQRLRDRMAAIAALSDLDDSTPTGTFIRLAWVFSSSLVGLSLILLLLGSGILIHFWRTNSVDT